MKFPNLFNIKLPKTKNFLKYNTIKSLKHKSCDGKSKHEIFVKREPGTVKTGTNDLAEDGP